MRLTVLGSGTLIPDDDRRSAAHWVEVVDARILLDCGAGTLHGFERHGVEWRRLTHLVISHFHTDHVGDVAPVLWALKHGVAPPREEPLTILGPPGTRSFLDALCHAHGDFVLEPGFPVRVVELTGTDRWDEPKGRFRAACHPTPHTDRSVCWRIESGEGSVGYTGDTGEARNVADFLRGVGVLVAECSLPDPPEVDTHLTPGGVAAMARVADPDLLLLTHLYPNVDPEGLPDLVRQAGYTGSVFAAWDGTSVTLEAGRAPRIDRHQGDGSG